MPFTHTNLPAKTWNRWVFFITRIRFRMSQYSYWISNRMKSLRRFAYASYVAVVGHCPAENANWLVIVVLHIRKSTGRWESTNKFAVPLTLMPRNQLEIQSMEFFLMNLNWSQSQKSTTKPSTMKVKSKPNNDDWRITRNSWLNKAPKVRMTFWKMSRMRNSINIRVKLTRTLFLGSSRNALTWRKNK